LGDHDEPLSLGVAALEVYLGLYRLARPVGAGSDKAARHC